jgi:hypothetical protein
MTWLFLRENKLFDSPGNEKNGQDQVKRPFQNKKRNGVRSFFFVKNRGNISGISKNDESNGNRCPERRLFEIEILAFGLQTPDKSKRTAKAWNEVNCSCNWT